MLGGRYTLYSGSMSSSISLPVRVRTLEWRGCHVSVCTVEARSVGRWEGRVLDVHGFFCTWAVGDVVAVAVVVVVVVVEKGESALGGRLGL